jgi:hypothetical protein
MFLYQATQQKSEKQEPAVDSREWYQQLQKKISTARECMGDAQEMFTQRRLTATSAMYKEAMKRLDSAYNDLFQGLSQSRLKDTAPYNVDVNTVLTCFTAFESEAVSVIKGMSKSLINLAYHIENLDDLAKDIAQLASNEFSDQKGAPAGKENLYPQLQEKISTVLGYMSKAKKVPNPAPTSTLYEGVVRNVYDAYSDLCLDLSQSRLKDDARYENHVSRVLSSFSAFKIEAGSGSLIDLTYHMEYLNDLAKDIAPPAGNEFSGEKAAPEARKHLAPGIRPVRSAGTDMEQQVQQLKSRIDQLKDYKERLNGRIEGLAKKYGVDVEHVYKAMIMTTNVDDYGSKHTPIDQSKYIEGMIERADRNIPSYKRLGIFK